MFVAHWQQEAVVCVVCVRIRACTFFIRLSPHPFSQNRCFNDFRCILSLISGEDESAKVCVGAHANRGLRGQRQRGERKDAVDALSARARAKR